jgi:hypothetical protein
MTAQAAERSGLATPRADEVVPEPEPLPARRLGAGPVIGLVALAVLLALGFFLWRQGGEPAPADAPALAVVRHVEPPAPDAFLAAEPPVEPPAPDAAPVKAAREKGRRARAAEPVAPPPAPPPPDPAPAGDGFLSVGAEPYALVRIDGKEVGSTPIIRRTLAAGDHEVVLYSPDSGAVRLSKRVSIRPGKHENIVLR